MKKKVFFLVLIIIIAAVFFTPASLQQTVSVKKSFLAIYQQLASPASWERWRPDLKKAFLADSNKIAVKKDTGSFTINYADVKIDVQPKGGLFDVVEHNNKTISYSYAIGPDKQLNKTLITVYKNTNLANYLINMVTPVSFADTHIDDFKHFMETDSLYYGCNIFKNRVPESNLIIINKTVLTANKFTEAATGYRTLQAYIKTNHIKQVQPLIAQFEPKGKDSTAIKVGIFIDREVKSAGDVVFTRMPKGGPLYSAVFRGEFKDRVRTYMGIHQYFIDQRYQSAILPFETYLDNKLPLSDTDKVNIKVNFSTYF